MADFMLDTDTVSFALRGQGQVATRLLDHRPSDICMSAFTLSSSMKSNTDCFRLS